MSKSFSRVVLVVIVIAVLGILLLILRGSEDRWLCRDGKWVKHGYPSAPTPNSDCD